MKIHISKKRHSSKPVNKGSVRNDLKDINTIKDVSIEKIAEAICKGYTVQPGICPDGTKGSFQSQQLFILDVDNDREGERETPESFNKKLEAAEIKAAFMYPSFSSEEIDPKTGKQNPIKFHVVIVCDEEVTDRKKRNDIYERLEFLSGQNDEACKDECRYYFGTNKGLIKQFTDFKATNSLSTLEKLPKSEPPKPQKKRRSVREKLPTSKKRTDRVGDSGPRENLFEEFSLDQAAKRNTNSQIPEGKRNATLSALAFRLLTKYGESEKAYEEYFKECDRADPRLPEDEEITIWNTAVQAYYRKKASDPNYISPEEWKRRQDQFELYMPREGDWTDAGQAEVFLKVYGDRFHYCKEVGFVYWDGQVCKKGAQDEALRCSKQLTDVQLKLINEEIKRIRQQNRQSFDDEEDLSKGLEKIKKHIQQRRGFERIKAVTKIAQSEVPIEVEDLDAIEYEINTPAGVYDLRTSERRDHSCNDLMSCITTISPDWSNMEKWEKFLTDITTWDVPEDDRDFPIQSKEERSKQLCEFLQVIFGQALIGAVKHEGLFVLYGETGANGKSTLMGVIQAVLGNYTATVTPELLIAGRNSSDKKFERARLWGKRVIFANEPRQNAVMDEGALKQTVSNDPIYAEFKNKDGFNFNPTHTIFITSNTKIKVNTKDGGTWRRLYLIPFNAQFTGEKRNANLREELISDCGGACLQWMLEGAAKFYASDCQLEPFIPDYIEHELKNWQRENDALRLFLDEQCEFNEENRVLRSVFNDMFKKYCQRNYLSHMSSQAINKEMKTLAAEYNFHEIRVNGNIVYKGVSVLNYNTVYSI